MKIVKINEKGIYFDNGNSIEYDLNEKDHFPYAWRRAKFHHIVEQAEHYNEYEALFTTEMDEDLEFEALPGFGFRFWYKHGRHLSIPCVSIQQSGYYSDHIHIYYNKKDILHVKCRTINLSRI